MKTSILSIFAFFFFAGCSSGGLQVNQVMNNFGGTPGGGNGGGTPPKPPAISGLSVDATGQRTATITWTTNLPSTSQVDFGLTTSYGGTARETIPVTSHSITLNLLAPGRLYHFQVSSAASGQSSASTDQTFTPHGFVSSSVILTPLSLGQGKMLLLPVSKAN